MNKKSFFLMEIFGAFFIMLMGAFFSNFRPEFINKTTIQLLTQNRNSVWEAIKVFIVPYCLWCFVEILILDLPIQKLFVTKVFDLYLFVCLVLVSFEISNYLNIEMSFFPDFNLIFLSLLLCQLVSYRIVTSRFYLDTFFLMSCVCLLLFFCLYILFTLFPPKLEVFYDFG
ncbi:MAG: DUF6512 family protein [Oscillospiraceae bacterium]|jgi:hypothetical protein|nr:DUF6512 family protein [Oscillospiraceae bacterium]